MQVLRELHISGPEGDAVYAGALYTGATGTDLLESVFHEAAHFSGGEGERICYARRIYRRRSADNGATWQEQQPDLLNGHPERLAGTHWFPRGLTRDPRSGVLVFLYSTCEVDPAQPQFGIGNSISRTYRTWYQLSHDGGMIWSEGRQVIAEGSHYDSEIWGPGFAYGEVGGVAEGQCLWLEDGTWLVPFMMLFPAAPAADTSVRATEIYSTTVYARARLSEDGSKMDWRFGDQIVVPYPKAAGGCCEPATALVSENRIFTTLRCQGDEAAGIPATRYTVLSHDGGVTWSDPEPLRYDDGETVWTPASVHQFFVSSVTGKTYVLANLLDEPVYAQTPRYPLAIAELDTQTCRVRRATVQVIQDLPPGAPSERRYTNWGSYEDRLTGELVLTMPEQPKHMDFSAMTKDEDYTADCIRIRIRL